MSDSNSNENKPEEPVDLESATTDENIQLNEAVFEGDIQLATMMLDSGFADVNYCDKDGVSILYVAVLARDVAMVKLLLKYQPALNTADTSRCSPTWLAALTEEDEIMSLLVQAGADVNERLNVEIPWNEMCPHKEGMSFLHLAVVQKNIPKITLLIEHGAVIDALDDYGISPLQAALQLEFAEVAKVLLEKGASIGSVNKRGETILQTALSFGNAEVISIILSRKPELNATDRKGGNALHYLAQAHVKNLEIAEALLKEGVFVNQAHTRSGVTPLHAALMSNKPSLYGADVNLRITSGYTAVNLAAVRCSAFVLRVLLSKGGNPNSITDTGETALHRSCRQHCVEKINTLLEYGADVNVKGKSGKTAIESLQHFRSDAAESLIRHIAKLESFSLFVDDSILVFIKKENALTEYRDSCLQELQAMKNLTFYDQFSFHYVLKLSIERLSKLAANEEFTENFKSFEVLTLFPLYGKEVDNNFRIAFRKMIAYNRLTEHLSLVFYRRYDSVLEHIVKYLKPGDIPLTFE